MTAFSDAEDESSARQPGRSMKTDLSGKVAFVTGAAGGIGKAIADALARQRRGDRRRRYRPRRRRTVGRRLPRAIAVEVDIRDRIRSTAPRRTALAEFGAARHPRQQCRRQHARPSRPHRRIPGRGMAAHRRHRSRRHLPRQPRRSSKPMLAKAPAASSISPRPSASPRSACRAPSSPPRPGSSTSPARWRWSSRREGILVNADRARLDPDRSHA